MLQFRAIHDYKGIREGQIWDLINANDEKEFHELYGIRVISHKEPVVVLERTVDYVTSHITITHSEFELNFEWVRGASCHKLIDTLREKCEEEIKRIEEQKKTAQLYSVLNSIQFGRPL